ncbi:MAG: hypothetical protein U0573_02030 [Phycisphaerales bacterium]|nr:hypothetical protein [Planctomycetota bacterium]
MKMRTFGILAAALCAGTAAQAVVVNVGDSSAGWLGYMNVFEIPANGGGYVFGSPWGVPDLVAIFDDPNAKLTLKVNSINDPNPFWYTPEGGPGSTGNKTMDAVLYHQVDDGSLTGVAVTFEGTVLSNSFSPSHVAKAFIRDFAPDYSSFNEQFIELAPGPFSFTLETEPGEGRHVQWGFNVVGPCVWITDADLFGNAVISTGTANTCPCDLNHDGFVDDADFVLFASAYNLLLCEDPTMPAGCPSDFNHDGFVDDADFVIFVSAYNELLCP